MCLFSTFSDQSATFFEFFHWLNCSLFLKFWLILSKIDFLALPMLLLVGSQQGKDDWKFGLWFFNDLNAGFFARHLILLSSSNFLKMCLASTLIAFSRYTVDFW